MKTSNAIKVIAACAGITWATASFSHISLENKTAAAGASYKAVLQVGHGCDGSATKALTVQIPPGFRGAKAMPKPGWTVTTQLAKLPLPYEAHGKFVTDDVVRITWQADTRKAMLLDAHFDQFTLRGGLHDVPGPLWFKVLQNCEKGRNDWSEVPVTGLSTHGLDFPAVVLEVTAAAPAGTVLPSVATAVPSVPLVSSVPSVRPASSAPVKVEDAWVRSTVPGQRGTGAFMKLTANEGLRLVGVTSSVAGVAEVHEMKMEGDVMKMRAVPGLDLPAGRAVELKPGGYHLMLMDLKQPLAVGSKMSVTLLLKDRQGADIRQQLNLPVAATAPRGKPGAAEHKH